MAKPTKPTSTKTKDAAPAVETKAPVAETVKADPAKTIQDVLGIQPTTVKAPVDNEEETAEALELRLAREASGDKPPVDDTDEEDELAAFEAEMEGKKKIVPETAFGEAERPPIVESKKKVKTVEPILEKTCKGNHSVYPNTEEFFDKNEDGSLNDYSKDYIKNRGVVVKGEPVKNPRRQQPQRVVRMPTMPNQAAK